MGKLKYKIMMKKIVALLFICSLILSNINVMGVTATTADTQSSDSGIDWSTATVLNTCGYYVISNSGNYILNGDIYAEQPYIISAGAVVNLNLNGYTITNDCNMEDYAAFDGDVYTDSIIFIYGGTLNLYDESSSSNGYYSTTTNSDTEHYWDDENQEIVDGTTNADGYNYTGGAITGGYSTKKLLGGAGVCVSSGTFNMYSGNIVGNTTDPAEDGILGAGVYVNTGATFNMYGGSVLGNTCSGNGGGIYNKGTTNIYDGAIISGNSANDCKNYGGGLYNAATMNIYGGTIEYNEALGGGGISNVGTLTMSGGSISNNYTTGSSGGVLIGWAATFTMTGGEISDNTTLGTAGGVGLKTYKGVFIMTGGEITGNSSNSYGGGVQVTNGDGFYIGGTAYIGENYMKTTLSNVWLDTDYYMTQISALTNTIGVTKAGGTGLVAVSSTEGVTLNGTTYKYTITEDQTTKKYISDEVYYEVLDIDETGDNLQYTTSFSEVDDKVYLRVERVITGTDQ